MPPRLELLAVENSEVSQWSRCRSGVTAIGEDVPEGVGIIADENIGKALFTSTAPIGEYPLVKPSATVTTAGAMP